MCYKFLWSLKHSTASRVFWPGQFQNRKVVGRSYRGEFVRFDIFSMVVFFCTGSVLKAIALTTVEILVED